MMIILWSALIGLLAGVVAALGGVGGGVIMVPAFVFLIGLDQKHAVATSLGAMIFTAIAATLRNHANDFVEWKVALATAAAAALTAWFAADLLRSLSNLFLTRFFGVILLIIGVRMLFFSK